MLLSEFLRILGLATMCCAATTQPFLRLAHNGTSQYIPPGLDETLSYFPIDSRFSIDFFALDYDISDKSMYMTGLKAMRELSRLPFDSWLLRRKFSDPQYGDIAIDILGLSPNLAVKHAMWSIFKALLTLGFDQFRGLHGVIYWTEPEQQRQELGRIFVIKSTSSVSVPGIVGPPENGMHDASKDAGDALVRRVAVSALKEAESNVTASKNNTTSLQVQGARNLRVEFEGPTLNKLGVFICAFGGIIGAASAPRPFVDFHHASLNDDRSNVELDFKLRSDVYPGRTRKLNYDDIVFMLYSIPRYMYDNNKFRAGQFVLLLNNMPYLEGTMGRIR